MGWEDQYNHERGKIEADSQIITGHKPPKDKSSSESSLLVVLHF